MKNINFNLKSIVQSKARWLLTILALLTLGVGQMWGTDLYVRGYGGWNATSTNKMTGTSSPWTFTAKYWSTNGAFKIGTSDWSISCGSASITFGSKVPMTNNGGSSNMSFPSLPDGGGIYTITVTLESETYKIKVDKVVEEGNAWKDITDPTVYFDNSVASYSNVSVVIGRAYGYGRQSQGYLAKTLSNISNTSLYYTQSIDNASGDASKYTTMLFANASMSGWTSSKQATEGVVGKTSYTNTDNDNLNSDIFLFKAASGEKGADLTKTSLSAYTDLNKTQTVQVRISEDNGNTYTDAANFAAWPSSITVARTFLSSATASSSPSATAMTATTTTGALTSSITFTGAHTTEYTFAGWSDTNSSPDGNTSKTYTITDAATKYAFYKRKQYTVSYGVYNSENGSIKLNSGSAVTSSSSSTLNHGTTISFTATPNSGYQVEGWYSTAACNTTLLQEGGNTYDAGTLTAATTVYVKFKVRTGGTITLSAGTGGEVSADNSSWGTSKTITNITSSSDINIYARPTTGYTFSSWNKSSGSGTVKTNAASGVFTPVAYEDATVTASFNETMSPLTTSNSYDAGNPGYAVPTVSSSATTVGYVTTRTITAAAAGTGYTFAGWTITNGVRTDEGDEDATTITVRSNGDGSDVSVVAKYEEDLSTSYVLKGGTSIAGSDYWETEYALTKKSGHSTENVAYYTLNNVAVTPANAQTSYNFKIVLKGASDTYYGLHTDNDASDYWYNRSTGEQTMTTDGGLHNNIQLRADVAGDYEIKVDYSSTPKITITFPTRYTVSYSVSPAGAAGAITTSPSVSNDGYVVDGTSITFTHAAANSGYTWSHWENGSGSSLGTDETYTTTISAATAVVAKYTEDMHDVAVEAGENGSVNVGEVNVGIATKSSSITATPNTGYYFSGWAIPDGVTIVDGNASSTTITIRATEDGKTLTANFVELDKIYFRNENETTGAKLWDEDNIYVYFNVSGFSAINAGASGVNPTADNFAQMSPINSDSKIYWAYIPRAITTSPGSKIAFSDKWMGSSAYPNNLYSTFYQKEGVYRTDYNVNLNMYVPACTSNQTSNQTKYYDNGYWMKYNTTTEQGASYYLKENTGSGELSEFKVAAANGTTIYTQYRFENTTAKTFYIANAAGIFYKASSNITSVASAGVNMETGNTGFTVTPTSEGYYTFYIDQSGDTMKITVNYPVSAGDYRLDYTYDTDKHLYSDIIKANTESSVTEIKKSVYVDPTSGVSLKLLKCTGINGRTKQPEWTGGVSLGTLGDIFTEGKGVYEFDLTIDNTGKTASQDASVSIENVALYTGNYYIKTDYAPGGWANYTENVLSQNTINFSKSDSKTFDYYHCAWVGDGDKNVKCIIANDYNQQLTDTLIGDDVLGTDGGNPRQYLATAANVRFSYNSYINELRRAYINGASGWEASFLSLKDMHSGDGTGDATITKTSGTTLTNDTISFLDKGNWIYQISVKAKENAYIYLSANYRFSGNDHQQDLIGTSSTGALLIGDGLGDTPEPITIIYDFKTNNLIAAWTPAEQAYGTEIDLNSDVLLIHNRKSDGTDAISKIDLTGSGKIKTIDRVYSAFRFQKTTADGIIGLSGSYSSTEESYYRYNYWISFPYDVKMTDIFGLPDYGSKWRIQYYDGAERASKGFYRGDGTTTFWKTMSMNDDATLKKGEGYVLQLSPSAFKATGSGSLWALVDELYLYFPSKAEFGNIARATSSITLAPYTCTKGAFTDGQNRTHDITDSHWHVFGIPTFNDATGTTGTGHDYYDSADADDQAEDHDITDAPFYFYVYTNNGTTCDTYTPTSSSGFTFQPMHAYMIQMHGTLNFTTNSVPASVAARRSGTPENYTVRLELAADGVEQDRTFVTLRDEAAADFALNEDMMKIHNSGRANIYSYAGAYDVASNILPVESRTVTLGVEVAADGTYTFRMPADISGTVTLLDNQTNTRTNLSAGDYEVYLAKGTYEGRFYLEIDVREVTTVLPSYDGYSDSDHVLKFVRDGHLFIRRQADTFDARGNRVR